LGWAEIDYDGTRAAGATRGLRVRRYIRASTARAGVRRRSPGQIIWEAAVTKRPFDYYLLWGVALLSLLINAGLVYALVVARQRAGEGAQTAAEAIAAFRTSSVDYTVHVDRTLPISLTVPFNTVVSVPISTTLPIDTEFGFSLHTLVGDFPVNIPVHAVVPVNLVSQVPVHLVVPISTSVPVVFDLPIKIDVAQTSFGQTLGPTQLYLEKLAADLSVNPLIGVVPR
jgi:hypothetical protein